jgi:hypothetical protein
VSYLDLEDLLHIARRIMPSVEPRDIGLLESTAAPPQSGAFGAVPSSSQHSKAAALLHSVAVGEVDDVVVIAKRLEGKTEHRDVRFRPS